jgi:hypothetical protein
VAPPACRSGRAEPTNGYQMLFTGSLVRHFAKRSEKLCTVGGLLVSSPGASGERAARRRCDQVPHDWGQRCLRTIRNLAIVNRAAAGRLQPEAGTSDGIPGLDPARDYLAAAQDWVEDAARHRHQAQIDGLSIA